MLAALLLAAAAPQAASEARLAALDHTRREQEARLAAAEQPLADLLAAAQRLALRSPAATLARPDGTGEMLRTRALIAWLAPQIRARTASARRALIATQALSALIEQRIAQLSEGGRTRSSAKDNGEATRLALLPVPVQEVRRPHNPAYLLPAPGRVIVGMGERSSSGVRARGLTLATRPGTTVVAPARARIAYAGPFRGYGDIVILDHGHGWTTLLAGLGLATADTGSVIDGGATLGRMPPRDPRLTIELRHGGQMVDVAAMALQ
jgi:murein hydrolase activator